jgi:tetratricopeptide (TPR) repeat protein
MRQMPVSSTRSKLQTVRFTGGRNERQQWAPAAGKWSFKNGVWSPQQSGPNLLVWQQPVPFDFRFICEGWVDDIVELTLVGRYPAEDANFFVNDSCMFQFGGELQSCSTLRVGHVVAAIRGLFPKRHRHYRLELEYRNEVFVCRVDGKKIFQHRELVPSPGSRLALYSWNKGAHFKLLSIEYQPLRAFVSAMRMADRLFEHGLFQLALSDYENIAASSADRRERLEARLKSGICRVRLGQIKEARRIYATLGNTEFEPFALVETAKLELHSGPANNPQRAVSYFRKLIRKYPQSTVRAQVVPFIYSRLRTLKTDAKSEEGRLRVRADLEELGRETCQPTTQFQVQCQVDRTIHLMELGQWKRALRELLDFRARVLPQHYVLVMIEAALLSAALANGREDLLPQSPFDLVRWDGGTIHSNSGTTVHIPVRRRKVAEFLREYEQGRQPGLGDKFLNERTVALAYLSLGGVEDARTQFEKKLFPLAPPGSRNVAMILKAATDSRVTELYRRIFDWLRNRGDAGSEADKAELLTAQAAWALEVGDLAEAARLLKDVHFKWSFSRSTLFQLMLASLGLLQNPGVAELKRAAESSLAGVYLNLARMFTGDVPPEPNKLWPHPLWLPELRLWLALWQEARGKRKQAAEIAAAAIDPRYGLTHCQPALQMLIKRTL